MNIRTISAFLVITFAAFFASGCVKEGPVGPRGPSGPAGLNGADGASAVISSPWYTPTAWSYDSNNKEYYFDVTNSEITQDIVENGVILAYCSLPNDVYQSAVRQMPAYALGCNWDYLIPDYGSIEFLTDAVATPGTSGYSFRFVLVPASVLLTKSAPVKSKSVLDMKETLKNMSYSEVCKMFNIKE